MFDIFFGTGIKSIIEEFKTGFNTVFPIESLKSFTSSEICETLCGSLDEKWDYEVLLDNVKPDHGYDRTSGVYQNLIRFMKEMDKNDKKKFLIFVTGSPRLPLGGI